MIYIATIKTLWQYAYISYAMNAMPSYTAIELVHTDLCEQRVLLLVYPQCGGGQGGKLRRNLLP